MCADGSKTRQHVVFFGCQFDAVLHAIVFRNAAPCTGTQQVEKAASDARGEYETACSKCIELRLLWEKAYEEWQDAVAALRKIGGVPPVDSQTEHSEALAVVRAILRGSQEPELELEPKPDRDKDSLTSNQAVVAEAEWQAVTTVQARQRGNIARRCILDQQSAATKIQSAQRGKRSRQRQQTQWREFGLQKEAAERPGLRSASGKRHQKLNAKSTFEPDGSGRVWRNTDQERAILYLTHK